MSANTGAIAVFAIATLFIAAPSPTLAQTDSSAFIGLWHGIDSVDGSLRTFSIADSDGDGTLEILANDTYWALCDGPGGLETLAGTVGDDGVFSGSGTITCRAGKAVAVETTLTPQGDGQLLEEVAGQPFSTLLFRVSR